MPYGIRYMAMCLRKNLKEKFPDSSEEEILKAVGMFPDYLNDKARFLHTSDDSSITNSPIKDRTEYQLFSISLYISDDISLRKLVILPIHEPCDNSS